MPVSSNCKFAYCHLCHKWLKLREVNLSSGCLIFSPLTLFLTSVLFNQCKSMQECLVLLLRTKVLQKKYPKWALFTVCLLSVIMLWPIFRQRKLANFVSVPHNSSYHEKRTAKAIQLVICNIWLSNTTSYVNPRSIGGISVYEDKSRCRGLIELWIVYFVIWRRCY